MILNVSDNLLSTPFVLGPLLSFFIVGLICTIFILHMKKQKLRLRLWPRSQGPSEYMAEPLDSVCPVSLIISGKYT